MVMQWWRERAPREQALLGGGAVVLLLTVAYLMIEPVLEERRRLAAEIPQLRQDLAWMQEHLAEVQRLRRAGTYIISPVLGLRALGFGLVLFTSNTPKSLISILTSGSASAIN